MLATVLHEAGLKHQADILQEAIRGASPGHVNTPPGREELPVEVAERYYEAALTAAGTLRGSDLAASLKPLGDLLYWTQTDTYVRAPPHHRFLQRYAHATILGSKPATAVLVDDSRTAAVGVLLLGPDNRYPHHQHHADEAYVPLTPAAWSSGLSEPYVDRIPGSALHHAPLQAHSVHSGQNSLLALYLWTGDTTTSAWLC